MHVSSLDSKKKLNIFIDVDFLFRFIHQLPPEVRATILRKYLSPNDLITLCSINRASRALLREECTLLYIKKTCDLYNDNLSWLSFYTEKIDDVTKFDNIVRNMKRQASIKDCSNPLRHEEIKYSISKNECCSSKILCISSGLPSSKLFVLCEKKLKVFDMQSENRLRPYQIGFHEWTDFSATKGCLKPSKEGSFVLVWRWRSSEHAAPTGNKMKNVKKKTISLNKSYIFSATIIDTERGVIPITSSYDSYKNHPRDKLLQPLEHFDSIAWISDDALIQARGDEPMTLVIYPDSKFLDVEFAKKTSMTKSSLGCLLSKSTIVEAIHEHEFPSDSDEPVKLICAKPCEERAGREARCVAHELVLVEFNYLNIISMKHWIMPGFILDIKIVGLMPVIMVEKSGSSNDVAVQCQRQIVRSGSEKRVVSFYKIVEEEISFLFEIPTENQFIKNPKMVWDLNEGVLVLIKDSEAVIEIPLFWSTKQQRTVLNSTTYKAKAHGVALGPYRDFYLIKNDTFARYTTIPLVMRINLTARKYEYESLS